MTALIIVVSIVSYLVVGLIAVGIHSAITGKPLDFDNGSDITWGVLLTTLWPVGLPAGIIYGVGWAATKVSHKAVGAKRHA